MSNTPTYGGTSVGQCAYCGNWHTYSEEMCRDLHKAHTQAPAVPTPFGLVTERSAVERERAAFCDGVAWADAIAAALDGRTEEAARRYPLPKEGK